MTPRPRYTLETLNGEGQVIQGGKVIATVLYSLSGFQEMQWAGTALVTRLKNVEGALLVIRGEYDLLTQDDLTLRLQDGREAVLSTTTGNAATGIYSVHVNLITAIE